MSEESVRKLKETYIRKFGSEENYRAYMRELAVKGGKKSRRILTSEQASEMGKRNKKRNTNG